MNGPRPLRLGQLMKQMVFLVFWTVMGAVGSFTLTPLLGIAVYYAYAVFRPQSIWEYYDAFGVMLGDVGWSRYVAVATLGATVLWRLGILAPLKASRPPWYGNPKFTVTHYLFLAFAGWIAVTYYMGMSQEAGELYANEYLKIFVMFFCATLVLRTVGDLWVIYLVVMFSASYIAVEINDYYFSKQVNYLHLYGFGGLDNNGAALIPAMAVPLAFFAWEATRHWLRWGYLLLIPFQLHAVMLSFSRGAMLSLCVVALLMFIRTRHKTLVAGVFLVLGLFVLAAAGKQIQDRFFSISQHEADGSAQSRWTTWGIAYRMANEDPVFGKGIRCSNLLTHKYGADIEGRTIHSLYLQTAADSGWVGLLIYLGLVGTLFVGLWRVRRFLRPYNDAESHRVQSMTSGLECSLFVFFFGAIFLSVEIFEMPYAVMLIATQLYAITRMVAAKYAPTAEVRRGGLAQPPVARSPEPAGANR